ncbi:hypothetical protein [Paenibacillus guangzhouensis]|uniref:hypothetical protein n=1 Tax=Paenibacillus guangzhouensis TaxID=1473112 RepID=UPI001266BDA8|nr:hypothetical protein [Paenibacillus guangzhouensis]
MPQLNQGEIKVEYNVDVSSSQMPVIRDFLYHYDSYKELRPLSNGADPSKSFIDYILTLNTFKYRINGVWFLVVKRLTHLIGNT